MRWHMLAWPLPALLGWGGAWALFGGLHRIGMMPALAWAAAVAAPLLLWPLASVRQHRWRCLMLLAGFPLSALAAGAARGLPAWAWLLPVAALAGLYPWRAWRDAPFYPTPADALAGLGQATGLPPQASVLDAGSGAGHGLAALHRALPLAQLHGVETSIPLAIWSRLRLATAGIAAQIRRADLWAEPWGGYALVYLFQRPETMPRAWDKARREMPHGSWLASLEFPIPGVAATARLAGAMGRPVWLYRLSAPSSAQPGQDRADNRRIHRHGA